MRSLFVTISSSLCSRSTSIFAKNAHIQFSRRWVNHNRTGKTRLCVEHAEFLDMVQDHGEGSIEYRVLDSSAVDSRVQVVELTLCNEPKKNAMSGRMMAQLADYLDSLLLDHERVSGQVLVMGVILRGQGSTFCAGADLSLVGEVLNTSERGLMMSRFMTDALTRLRNSSLISLSLLNGPAVGGGAELCTATDFRLMVNDVEKRNHVRFIHARLGASPGWGGAHRLQSIVGRSQALRLLGGSQRVTPQQAEVMGLVDQLVTLDASGNTSSSSSSSSSSDKNSSSGQSTPDEGLLAALRFLQPFTSQPYPDAVFAMKGLVVQGETAPPDAAMAHEQRLFGQRWASADHRDASRTPDK